MKGLVQVVVYDVQLSSDDDDSSAARCVEAQSFSMVSGLWASQGQEAPSGSVAFSPGEGRYLLASGSNKDGDMSLWNMTAIDSSTASPFWWQIFKAVVLDNIPNIATVHK